jgi:hypothetical protein
MSPSNHFVVPLRQCRWRQEGTAGHFPALLVGFCGHYLAASVSTWQYKRESAFITAQRKLSVSENLKSHRTELSVLYTPVTEFEH